MPIRTELLDNDVSLCMMRFLTPRHEKPTDAFPYRGCFSLMNNRLVEFAVGEQRELTEDEEGAH